MHPLSDDERFIRTERLAIAASSAADAGELFPLLSHPELTYIDERPPSAEALQAYLADREAASRSNGEAPTFWTIRDEGSGEVVGLSQAEVRTFDVLHPDRAPTAGIEVELTIHIHPDEQRDGYGREALVGVANHYAQLVDAERVEAKIHHTNKPSRELAIKLGFVSTGAWDEKGHEWFRAPLPLPTKQ